ncbi:hypothetical protein BDP27DRAFT_1418288 [Rhodocollybia butyracea]|uniref:Uncharacterized protein n=1 Tax=Rhodocollybia butyracea TaxID=206335 RepID=A0A9P5PZA9_9AGAR|nr:hypothetical protein BDP27DRAFT_1418288 [Rhodocollybia butyracea]
MSSHYRRRTFLPSVSSPGPTRSPRRSARGLSPYPHSPYPEYQPSNTGSDHSYSSEQHSDYIFCNYLDDKNQEQPQTKKVVHFQRSSTPGPFGASRDRQRSSTPGPSGVSRDCQQSSTPVPSGPSQDHQRSSTPVPSGPSRDRQRSSTPVPSEAPREQTDESDSNIDNKVPKPPGEVGRPGRGGYNLRVQLQWTDEKYDKIKAFINKLVNDKLDCTISITQQIATKLEAVQAQAISKYPLLDEYRDHWVLNDFIKNRLKVCKAALHKEELEKVAAEAQKKGKMKT